MSIRLAQAKYHPLSSSSMPGRLRPVHCFQVSASAMFSKQVLSSLILQVKHNFAADMESDGQIPSAISGLPQGMLKHSRYSNTCKPRDKPIKLVRTGMPRLKLASMRNMI